MSHFYESRQWVIFVVISSFWKSSIFFSDFFSFIQGGAHNEMLASYWPRQKAQRKKNKMRGRFEERFEWTERRLIFVSLLRHIQKREKN